MIVLGEGRVAQTVARTVEADHETVADQIVAAHAVEFDQILDPGGGRGGGRGEPGEAGQKKRENEFEGVGQGLSHHMKFENRRLARREVTVKTDSSWT